MTELDKGIELNTMGSQQSVPVRGWCVCLSADYPAAGLCSGFKRSVSASVFCRECYVDQRDNEGYPAPNSFMADNDDLSCKECLRSKNEHDTDYAKYSQLPTSTARERHLSDCGLNSFHEHAFTRVPHFDVTSDIPYDFMHVELEGTLKNELAAMMYYFIRKRDWGFTIDKFNDAIENYHWPQGYAPATLTSGELEKGTKQGYCLKGCHVNWTAGDMALFVRHSIDLLEPLIGDTNDELWRCWVLHTKYVRILMQHSISHEELLELDRQEVAIGIPLALPRYNTQVHMCKHPCTQVHIRAPQVVPLR